MNTSSSSFTLSLPICICSFLLGVSTIFFSVFFLDICHVCCDQRITFETASVILFSVWVCLRHICLAASKNGVLSVTKSFSQTEVLSLISLAHDWMFRSARSLQWDKQLCVTVQAVLYLKPVSKFLYLELVCSRFFGVMESEDLLVGILKNEKWVHWGLASACWFLQNLLENHWG